jgi:hypothetical protein
VAAKDHHTALRSEVLGKINSGYVEIVLAKLHSGKDDVAFILHVNPSAFTQAGSRRPTGSDFWGSRRTRNANLRMRASASARKYRKGTISCNRPAVSRGQKLADDCKASRVQVLTNAKPIQSGISCRTVLRQNSNTLSRHDLRAARHFCLAGASGKGTRRR